jgi:predicted metal-dependent hydrolase
LPVLASSKRFGRLRGLEARLADSQKVISRALRERRTARILSTLFDRLYALRNQLVHGGATWSSSVNRDQVRDGAAVLGSLLPS